MLGSLQGPVIIDEIQAMPELFRVLRVLVDRPGKNTRFLILGSASPDLVKNASESLAGRVEFVELSGFSLHETGIDRFDGVWLRGGFPRSFLADSDEDSLAWREGFIQTFLALESLNLAHLWIVYPGEHAYPLTKTISVWPIRKILTLPEQLR